MKIFVVAVDVTGTEWASDVQDVTEDHLEKLNQGLEDFANRSTLTMVIDETTINLNVGNLVAVYVKGVE